MPVFIDMMGFKRQIAAAFILVGIGVSGCAFFRETADIIVQIPAVPEDLEAVAEGARFELLAGSETVADELEPGHRVPVSVPSGDPIAIRAYMRVPGLSVRLPPAGAVIRESTERGDLSLSFDAGVAATVVARVSRAGVPTSAVNIERLIREVEERAGERQWDIDIESVVDAFVADEMHARNLEPIEGPGVEVDLASGTWVRMDALRPELISADPEHGLVLASLSPGTHVYAAEDLSEWLIISVSGDGEAGWMRSPRGGM